MSEKTILLVEDDRDQLMGMNVRLRSVGYNVVAAGDAISAISAVRKAKPDLIVLDLGLPGGDGFVIMERLRSLIDLALIPIIVVSGRDPATNKRRALEAGAQAYIQKPIDNQELLAAIEKALGKSSGVGSRMT